MNGMVYRGEIYYVLPEGNEVGCEQRSGRPVEVTRPPQSWCYVEELKDV